MCVHGRDRDETGRAKTQRDTTGTVRLRLNRLIRWQGIAVTDRQEGEAVAQRLGPVNSRLVARLDSVQGEHPSAVKLHVPRHPRRPG